MRKERITYTDYNDEQRAEDFYFNLDRNELAKMNFMTEGGMESAINRIIDSKNVKEIVELFDTIILTAYGIKSADGRRFDKSEKISDDFKHTRAYDVLYMKLIEDSEYAAAFIRDIVPKDLMNEANKRSNLAVVADNGTTVIKDK